MRFSTTTMMEPDVGESNSGTWRRPSRSGQRRRKEADQPPCSKLWAPFGPGAVVRVRYQPLGPDRRPGGGALNLWSGGDIVLHVNPRPHPDHHALVLNAQLGGGWGQEERPDGYPLHDNEVTLSVWAGPEGFYIQATAAGAVTPFGYCYVYRHKQERLLDRITIDLPGVTAIEVRAEL